jgi:hypothetical protein
MFEIIKEKLITHEDPYYLHKFLGLSCLFNYGYQYYMYFRYSNPILNIYTLLPHFLLHYSSFIFKVLEKRLVETRMTMFIWKEVRLHSLIFAYRACLSILFTDYCQIITLLAMISADIVTNNYGTLGVSSIRGQQNKFGKRSMMKELAGAFFSISQMGATIITSGIFQPNPSKILIFSTLPPIQTAAFGMTLIRKNIINKNTWSIIYSIELFFTYYIWYKECHNLHIIPLSVLIYLLRRVGFSKYIIWSNAFIIHNLYYNQKWLIILN